MREIVCLLDSRSSPRGAAGAGRVAAEGALPRPHRGAGARGEAGDAAGAAEGGARGQPGGVGGALQDHAAAAARDAGRQRCEDEKRRTAFHPLCEGKEK